MDEEYGPIERDFWETFNERHTNDEYSSHSQYRIVFDHLIPKIRRSAEKDCLSADGYDLRLQEAEQIVDDIAFALSVRWREQKQGWIWFNPTVNNLNLRPDTWDDVSPVDTSRLDNVTARYLQRPWMQLNLLDWYILNGYVFDEAARLADAIKSGQAIGITNWAHIFSDGDIVKTIYWRAAFQIAKFLARWILVPAIIIAINYVGFHETAKWIAIPYGIYLIIHVTLFPRRYFRRKALTKELKEWQDSLECLVRIYQSSSSEVFSPSRLRDLTANSESGHLVLRPAVYSILDRAIERDPSVFAIEGSG